MSDELNTGTDGGQQSGSIPTSGTEGTQSRDFADFSSIANDIRTQEPTPAKADDNLQIPALNADETAETPDEPVQQQDETVLEKPSRLSNFKQLEEKAATLETNVTELTTARDTLQAKVDQFEQTVERYGGIDKFQELESTVFSKILSPTNPKEAVDFITGLPHGGAIRSEIMFSSIGLDTAGQALNLPPEHMNVAVGNQAIVLNSMLKGFQGVDANITPDELDTLGQYMAFQISERRDEFFNELKTQVDSFVDPRDKELRTLRAQAQAQEAAKNQPQKTENSDPFEEATRVAGEVKTFHNEIANSEFITGKPEMPGLAEKYKLAPDAALPKEVQTANEKLLEMINVYLFAQMQGADVQANLAEYLRTAKRDNPTFFLSANPYKSAVSAKAKEIFKAISPRLNGVASTPPPPAKTKVGAADNPASTNNSQTNPEPGVQAWEDFPSGKNY